MALSPERMTHSHSQIMQKHSAFVTDNERIIPHSFQSTLHSTKGLHFSLLILQMAFFILVFSEEHTHGLWQI